MNYSTYFQLAAGNSPRQWQADFADEAVCQNRFVPIGTGLGKTLGLMLAWYYHRIVHDDNTWPRRLVWCLPMRVLVEQTADEFRKVVTQLSSAYPNFRSPLVHVFMGGIDADSEANGKPCEQWHLNPERCSVLVGTQDMLLSRALARGYAAARGRWPIDFGLLHSDCLWVFDEVQLMGVGAVTGAQLQAFRDTAIANGQMTRPSYTWWASATLRPQWLATVDSQPTIEAAEKQSIEVPPSDTNLPVFAAKKPMKIAECHGKIKTAATDIAQVVVKTHCGTLDGKQSGSKTPCVTLVVLNRVDDAIAICDKVIKELGKDSHVDVRLIHSRFRGRERRQWRDNGENDGIGFLSRRACEDANANRIIVSTQVVEAGVDISAGGVAGRGGLVTELAPFSSLVQRFGRAARYGGTANVVVIDRGVTKGDALPYDEDSLAASLEALSSLDDVGLTSLTDAEARWRKDAELDQRLFRLDYQHLLRHSDFDELFDTSPDLTGDDIDISRYLREGEESNALVCWYVAGEDCEEVRWSPPVTFSPERDDLCPVPFIEARKWLLDPARAAEHRKVTQRFAYVWDFADGQWRPLRSVGEIVPGSIVLADARIGGYDVRRGFVGKDSRSTVADAVSVAERNTINVTIEQLANAAQSSDALSIHEFQTIADHGWDVGEAAATLGKQLDLREAWVELLRLAGYWHDWGKSHPVFQGNIIERPESLTDSDEIAKAPATAWRPYWQRVFNHPEKSLPRFERLRLGKRRGFRHELASVLGLLELLARADSHHEALLGDDPEIAALGDIPAFDRLPDESIVEAFRILDATPFNLVLYLIAAHHGKVRCGLHMTEADQENTSQPIRGVCQGDQLPSIKIYVADDPKVRSLKPVPSVTLHTDVSTMGWNARYGASWTERVIHLREHIGPFDLALLEAVLRAADVKCSSVQSVPLESVLRIEVQPV